MLENREGATDSKKILGKMESRRFDTSSNELAQNPDWMKRPVYMFITPRKH